MPSPTVTITETDHSTYSNAPLPDRVPFDIHATGPVRTPVLIVNTDAEVERVMGQPQKPTDNTSAPA